MTPRWPPPAFTNNLSRKRNCRAKDDPKQQANDSHFNNQLTVTALYTNPGRRNVQMHTVICIFRLFMSIATTATMDRY